MGRSESKDFGGGMERSKIKTERRKSKVFGNGKERSKSNSFGGLMEKSKSKDFGGGIGKKVLAVGCRAAKAKNLALGWK